MKKFLLVPKNFIYLISILVFLMSFVLHFIYDWTGESVIVGAFAPIDESIWEHTKLSFFPLLVLYSVYYIVCYKKTDIDKEKWFTCMLLNVLISVLLIPMLYYFINSGFGIENTFVNIMVLLVSLVIGSLISAHFYKYGRGINFVLSVCIAVFLIFIYILFTFSKVNLPMFYE